MALEADLPGPLAKARGIRHSPAMDRLARSWLIVCALVSLGALAVAHGFQTFGHLSPCELCLKAREVWWMALAVAAAGFVLSLVRPVARPMAIALLTVVFLGGVAVSVYHAGAEWKFWAGPASCSGVSGGVNVTDIGRMLKGGSAAPSCEKPAWVFLGLSMAGWDGVLFALMAALSVAVAPRSRA